MESNFRFFFRGSHEKPLKSHQMYHTIWLFFGKEPDKVVVFVDRCNLLAVV